MRLPRIKRKPPWAKTAVYYATAIHPKSGEEQACIYLECTRSGRQLGPVWGQSRQAVDRGLSRMALLCDCPAQWHKASYYYGQPAASLAPKPDPGAE